MKITFVNVFLYCKVFDAAEFAIWNYFNEYTIYSLWLNKKRS